MHLVLIAYFKSLISEQYLATGGEYSCTAQVVPEYNYYRDFSGICDSIYDAMDIYSCTIWLYFVISAIISHSQMYLHHAIILYHSATATEITKQAFLIARSKYFVEVCCHIAKKIFWKWLDAGRESEMLGLDMKSTSSESDCRFYGSCYQCIAGVHKYAGKTTSLIYSNHLFHKIAQQRKKITSFLGKATGCWACSYNFRPTGHPHWHPYQCRTCTTEISAN